MRRALRIGCWPLLLLAGCAVPSRPFGPAPHAGREDVTRVPIRVRTSGGPRLALRARPSPTRARVEATEDAETVTRVSVPARVAASPAPAGPLPINLAAALHLADAPPADVAFVQEKTLEAARLVYARGQRARSNVSDLTSGSITADPEPEAPLALSHAVYNPLAARQSEREPEDHAGPSTSLAVAEAYFGVQQARGELACALDAARRARDLVERAERLARGALTEAERDHLRTECDQLQRAVEAGRERWRAASAELAGLLRLPSATLLAPLEPAQLSVEVVDLALPADDFIVAALQNRPELAPRRHLVGATLRRLEQRQLRPTVPSAVLRGHAADPGGIEPRLLREFQALGLGDGAKTRAAVLDLFVAQDRVAAEVALAHAEAHAAAHRRAAAESALRDALDAADRGVAGFGQTYGTDGRPDLAVSPHDAAAAVRGLADAYAEYCGAVADANCCQFRLYRAAGAPARPVAE